MCVIVYICVCLNSWAGVCQLSFWLVRQSVSVIRPTGCHRYVDSKFCTNNSSLLIS